MRSILIFISILTLPFGLKAQTDSVQVSVCDAVVENGDTLAVIMLDPAVVSDNKRWNKTYRKRFNKLEPKVIKVYPYAKAAGDLMKQYNAELLQIDSERERKAFIKKAEEEMKNEFEGDLRSMTVSEGVILIKLIDRETGDTSYELIQELKGSFSAFMWQTLARIFGHNLKDLYDADGDDIIIEAIVQRIEKKEIEVNSKDVSIRSTDGK